jgi:hypothetical protein
MKYNDVVKKWFNKPLIEYIKILEEFKSVIITASKENTEWLASNLPAVHNIVFKDVHYDLFFSLLDINEEEFAKDLLKMSEYRKEWKTSSNPMYVALMTIIVLALKDKDLRDSDRERLILNCGFIINFKIYTSKYKVFFNPLFDIDLSKKIYEKMSNLYLLKQYGSHYGVIEHLSRMLLPGTKHAERLKTMKFEKVIYVINAISGAIASQLKFIWKIRNEIEEENSKNLTKSQIEEDEEDRISEINHTGRIYHQVAKKIVTNHHSLIDRNLIKLINDSITNVDNKLLVDVIKYIPKMYLKDPAEILEYIEHIVNGSIKYLYRNEIYMPFEEKFDLVFSKLKGAWSSNKVKDPDILQAKSFIIEVLHDKFHVTKHNVLVRHASVISLYLFSRVILDMKLSAMKYHKRMSKALKEDKIKL